MEHQKACVDVMLPDEWYSHRIQDAMFKAGLKIPVYAADIEASAFGEGVSVPRDDRGVCYVPGLGDDFLVDHFRMASNPIGDLYNPEHMCVVITTPLRCFDNNHWLGAKVIVHGQDAAFVTQKDSLPDFFQLDVARVLEQAREGIAVRFPGASYSVVGARLNRLTSGHKNIVMFVHFDAPHGLDKQEYVRVHDETMPHARVRVIPRPVLRPPSHVSVVKLQVDRPIDDGLFEQLFGRMQDAVREVTGDLAVFRHMKFNGSQQELQVCLQHDALGYDISCAQEYGAMTQRMAELCAPVSVLGSTCTPLSVW